MTVLRVNLNVHRIGEAVARMVADRNLEDSAARVDIAAKDSQARTTPGDLQLFGRCCRSGYGLDGLDHSRNPYLSMFLKLLKKRLGRSLDPLRRFSEIRVNIDVRDRDRQAFPSTGTNPLEVKPGLRSRKADLFGVFLRKSRQSNRLKNKAGVRRVLQDLFDVRQRLVQCTGPGSRRLNQGSGSAAALDKSFRLKHPQGFADRESTDSVPIAKNCFGRKLPIPGKFAAEYFFTKNLGEFQISWLLLGFSRSFGQQLSKLSLST